MALTRESRFSGLALVTGAVAGIGRATAERLAADGAHVIVTDVDREGGEGTVTRINEADDSAEFQELDVTDAEAFEAVVDAIGEDDLDAVVNNTGIGHPASSVEETNPEVFNWVIDVNCRGVWNSCRAALR